MKKLFNYRHILAVISMALLLCSFSPGDKDKEYCNGRFVFCITYPNNFKGEGESPNGDGQIFTGGDGAEIRAFGSLAITDFDQITDVYKTAVSDIKVVYKVVKPSYFIFSGTDKSGNIVYRKTIKKNVNYLGEGATAVFQTLMITYPAASQAKYAGYCTTIAKSL
ncbi:MAG TPA: hypothetical protein VM802_27320 [Chitinophaga sp.]|uniref:hypothetical protein n=1 Tax=Chitinophaga sp. TaxID=1869181 RepID=UPI002C071131|nr:hypothetical protein [Chitinophaga sp.]HVI48609.1 hypothetical protein [Chitinophaga sp.]